MVRNNGPWNPMRPHSFFKVQLGHQCGIIGLITRYEIGYLIETITHHKDGVIVPLSLRQTLI